MILAPERIPLVAAGVAMLALAGTVLWMDFAKRVNRAFAVYLVARALSLMLPALQGAHWERLALAVQPYFNLVLLPAVLHFASLYPRWRGFLSRPWGGWAAAAAGGALVLLYVQDHALYYTIAERDARQAGLAGASAHWAFAGFGPLAAVALLFGPVQGLVGLLFVRDYLASAPGTQRLSYFLVAAGFLLNAIFDGSRGVALLVALGTGAMPATAFPWAPWGWSVVVLPALALAPGLAGAAMVAVHRFRHRDQERSLERRFFVLAAAAALTGLAGLALPAGMLLAPPMLVLLGIWRLMLPLLVTYALLRYALFDMDIRARTTLGWSLVTALFGGVYFVTSELLEGWLAEGLGTLGGLAVAAGMTVGIKPIAAGARKVATIALPHAPIAAAPKTRARDIYLQQFLMLQEDGHLTQKERRSLEALRDHLGLTAAAVAAVERRAQASRSIPLAGPGAMAV